MNHIFEHAQRERFSLSNFVICLERATILSSPSVSALHLPRTCVTIEYATRHVDGLPSSSDWRRVQYATLFFIYDYSSNKVHND